jgi:glutathione S-transferase
MAVTLYTTPYCPFCDRVKDELDRRAIAYEEVAVPVIRSQRKELFRLTGQRRVPVLVDDGAAIHDSIRILAHLARKYS